MRILVCNDQCGEWVFRFLIIQIYMGLSWNLSIQRWNVVCDRYIKCMVYTLIVYWDYDGTVFVRGCKIIFAVRVS